MTDAEKRAAALFALDVYRHEAGWRRRRPLPYETVIASYATAKMIEASFIGNPVMFLGAPKAARGCLAELSDGVTRPSAQLADAAEAALRYMREAGDLPGARPDSIAKDQAVIEELARNYLRTYDINDSEAGRRINLSHTQCRDRRLARSARILNALHQDCPTLWGPKLRPLADVLMSRDEETRELLAA